MRYLVAVPNRSLNGFLLMCLGVMAIQPAAARADDTELVAKMSAGRIERIVQSFRETQNFKELDNNSYVFEVDGLKIVIFNQGETMQLFAGFEGKVTLSRINEWNQTKRFTRAYIRTNGKPALEGDIELTGGVTEGNVKEWMKTYVSSLKAFKKHLEE